MIKDIKLTEVIDDSLNNYSLCYIDNIEETYFDYEEHNDNDSWFHHCSTYREKPNPEFIKGEQELYAYFTPISLDEQTGDDWNDAPYDCNAGSPYDTDKNNNEITLIRIPFAVKSFNYTLPKEYGFNTPFCVDDINHHACAWIYDCSYNKSGSKYVAILAGVSPKEFKDKLEEIHKNNPNWNLLEEDD